MHHDTKFRVFSKISIALFPVLVLFGCGEKTPQNAQTTSQLQPAENPAVLTAQVNTSPLFESPQGWGAGFALAKVGGQGVVVGPGGGNPNVFAQQFPAKPGEPFRIVARASSIDKPTGKGRFQINWLGPDYKFISASIKAFDVTTEEKTFEFLVTAPADAIAGTLYVAPDGSEHVVRYTEMRLLGKEKVKAN